MRVVLLLAAIVSARATETATAGKESRTTGDHGSKRAVPNVVNDPSHAEVLAPPSDVVEVVEITKAAETVKAIDDLKEAQDRKTLPLLRALRAARAPGTVRQCSPTLFRVFRNPRGTIEPQFSWNSLSVDDVLNHVIVTLPFTQFAKVPETPFSNVDGRINHPVLGAMGGDAGEFLLALNTFERTIDKPLTEFQVASLFSDYVLLVDKNNFYLQTDQMALINLCRKRRFCLPQDRLDSPEPQMLPILRSELVLPENIGCSHIKHILKDPEGFKTRKELVEAFIISYFNLLWGVPINTIAADALAVARSKLKLQVLSGPHTEGAILHVDTSDCSPRFTPMIIPEFQKVSIGVCHVDAVSQLRTITARFLTDQTKKMGITSPSITDPEFVKRTMDQLAHAQFEKAKILDGGKTPIYTLKYPPECCMGTPQPRGAVEEPPFPTNI